eukprot:scaffold62709_cov26-Prasinocladus_malaysianus.AAC.1
MTRAGSTATSTPTCMPGVVYKLDLLWRHTNDANLTQAITRTVYVLPECDDGEILCDNEPPDLLAGSSLQRYYLS